MPHDGWLEMAKPFIAAYKAGSQAPSITGDQLIYWYRPNSKSLDCDATDTTIANDGSTENSFKGKPNGADDVADSVFVVAMLKEAGTVVVNSGSNSKTFNAPAGAHAFAVPMGVGKQSFSLQRGSETVMSETSLKEIVDSCICGIYNFNAYVGTVPAGPSEPLPPSGLKSLTVGLHVETCKPTPSLGMAPIAGPSEPAGNDTASVPQSSTPKTTSVPANAPIVTISAPVLSKPTISPTSISTSVAQPPYTPPYVVSSITAVPLPAAAPAANAGLGGRTITASAQLAPTNCLLPGDVWVVPPPSAVPDHCDVS